MQTPILNGIYTDGGPEFRVAYPRNLIPVPKQSGVSAGYLRPADGIELLGTGPGRDRGAINWNGVCYRVMGTKLVSVAADGTVTELGNVGGSTQATLAYSFTRLIIASNGNLFYWNETDGLLQVTDPDLGVVVDVDFIDGYTMTTDGENLVVTDLNDPFSVNPLKYGSSEVDPDPVLGVIELTNEICALNRYTVEMFENVGGNGFPFRRIDGAQLRRGPIGTHAACVFNDALAFLGSGRNEAPAIWLGLNGQTEKLSTADIDTLLENYTEAQLSDAILESRVSKGQSLLYVHLPDQTLGYDLLASKAAGEQVWFTLTTSIDGLGQYRARNLVWCYDRWIVGDPATSNIGRFTSEVSSHWSEVNGWEFSTLAVYNEGMGAIVHQMELVALTGRIAIGKDPVVWASYSTDGTVFSIDRPVKAGRQGERNKRLVWLQQGSMRSWRVQKFKGTSDAHIAPVRLDMKVEALSV